MAYSFVPAHWKRTQADLTDDLLCCTCNSSTVALHLRCIALQSIPSCIVFLHTLTILQVGDQSMTSLSDGQEINFF